MWTVVGAIAAVIATIPLCWKVPDLFGADVVVDRVTKEEVVLANRSKYADAQNVRITIAGRGDADFELGDDPDTLNYSSVRWKGSNGSIPPQGEMRLGLKECRPDFDWLPGQIEVKTMWEDDLSTWLPQGVYSPSNKRRFNRDKFY